MKKFAVFSAARAREEIWTVVMSAPAEEKAAAVVAEVAPETEKPSTASPSSAPSETAVPTDEV